MTLQEEKGAPADAVPEPIFHSPLHEDTDVLSALLAQEEDYRIPCDFFDQLSQEYSPTEREELDLIDADCRSKMVDWAFRIVEYIRLQRETVAIAFSFVDRYIWRSRILPDRRRYQLLVMTCLYSAVKMHEPAALDPATMERISRGTYKAKEIENVELLIVQTIGWRLNPSTPMHFVQECLQHLMCQQEEYCLVMNDSKRQVLYQLALEQTELALAEHELLTVRSSIIAYCALLNAWNMVTYCETGECHNMDSSQPVTNLLSLLLLQGQCHREEFDAVNCTEQSMIGQIQEWLQDALVSHKKGMPLPPRHFTKAVRRSFSSSSTDSTVASTDDEDSSVSSRDSDNSALASSPVQKREGRLPSATSPREVALQSSCQQQTEQ